MTFSSIIRKNFIYNFKKYMSLYFVNTLIVAILFMFGSLFYNSDVLEQVGETTLYETIKTALLCVVLFSIVFITYSNVTFLKYRGKEFGMYITLGMTTKDLTKLLLIENTGIMVISILSGHIVGGLFGKLFYLGLNQMVIGDPIAYELNGQILLLSIGIFLLIFICNFIFNIFYLRKASIVDVLKSSSKKGIGKSNIVLGVIAIILFVGSVYLLPKMLLEGLFKNQSYMMIVFVVLTLTCPYVIIGTMFVVLKSVIKRFKRTYNNHLIVLSNVSHRFLSYKTTLYMVSILIAGALFFIGMVYAMYATSEDNNERDNPFDVMFVETNQFNHMNANAIEEVFKNNANTIEENKTLEYIELPEFRSHEGAMVLWDDRSVLISESHYNDHMGTHYEVAVDQALSARVYEQNMDYEVPDTLITAMNTKSLDDNLRSRMSKEALIQTLSKELYFEYNTDDFIEITAPFINNVRNKVNYYGTALVVDDQIYDQLKSRIGAEQVKILHLIKGDVNEQGYQSLLAELRNRNGLDSTYWTRDRQNNVDVSSTERAELEGLKPFYKKELLEEQLESSGLTFFIVMFLGALFAIASGVVLFHKVLSDIDDQKESILSLKRIGVTTKEIKSIVSKELFITFFFPTFFGLGLGMYYFYFLFSNQPMLTQLLGKASMVAVVFLVLQIGFYYVSRRKYFSELNRFL